MPSSSASPMPPYALGSALSLLMWPANARPKADARRLASVHSLQFELREGKAWGVGVGGIRVDDGLKPPAPDHTALNSQGTP